MTGYTYRVVPFIGSIKESESPSQVAKQLQDTINEGAADGWEFVQVTEVKIYVAPGCLGRFFGQSGEYLHRNQVVFRMPWGD